MGKAWDMFCRKFASLDFRIDVMRWNFKYSLPKKFFGKDLDEMLKCIDACLSALDDMED